MKIKIIIATTAIILLSSCTSWNSEDNPIENGVKKFGGFVDNIKNKVGDRTKYSILSKNREKNKDLYYKESLNKFLEFNYKTTEHGRFGRSIHVVEDNLRKSDDKTKVLKEINKKISNFCVKNKVNYPKFHKRKGIKNIFNQFATYSIKDQRILAQKLQFKDIGKYIGEFSCFKKYAGDIWIISIKLEVEKIGENEVSFIKLQEVTPVRHYAPSCKEWAHRKDKACYKEY